MNDSSATLPTTADLDDLRRGRTANRERARAVAWLRADGRRMGRFDMDAQQTLEEAADALERCEHWVGERADLFPPRGEPAAAKARDMPDEDQTMQALPIEQAPTNGDHFLGLIEVPTPDDTGYREWREVYRDTDGVLYVPRPEDDLPLSDAYGEEVAVVGYLPLPSKQTE